MIEPCGPEVWPIFAPYHYLPEHSRCTGNRYICVGAEGALVGFVSAIAMPARWGHLMREHRLVVLPEFRGQGIGRALSEWMGEAALASGHRYYSRTRNLTVAAARDRSPRWVRTDHTNPRQRDGHRRLSHIPLVGVASVGHRYIGAGERRNRCAQCGRWFTTRRAHARYCDVACRVAAHRAR